MPIIVVNRDSFFRRLGREFTEDEFRTLCFEYGIELDDVTSEREMRRKETGEEDLSLSDEVLYKIELPANRYDILCEEGLSQALRVFLEIEPYPTYVLSPSTPQLTMTVRCSTRQIRPYVVCAVLRDVTLTQETLDSFMALQDRLHFNIGRRRSLVAIGTHDLDTLTPPFVYTALPPTEITFNPLTPKDDEEYRADALLDLYESDPSVKHLKPYVKLIKNSPVYPIIFDTNDVVLSLPPLINGDHSKMTTETKNIFIECTSKDHTKAMIVLLQIVANFSQYCSRPYHVEPVQVIYEPLDETQLHEPINRVMVTNSTSRITSVLTSSDVTPSFDCPTFEVSLDRLTRIVGINITGDECIRLLGRMQMKAELVEGGEEEGLIRVTPPITRCDVLQERDIAEDVAIGYGYNNIEVTQPQSMTVGQQDPLNHLCDGLRSSLAECGYTEIYTLSLIRLEENYEMMNLARGEMNQCVRLANAKCSDFECVRTSLLPTMLKTIAHNLKILGFPLQFFEVNDITILSSNTDTGAENRRKVCASFCSRSSQLEIVHGTLDRIMLLVRVPFMDSSSITSITTTYYKLVPSDHPSFFRGQHADIVLVSENGGSSLAETKIGDLGTISPLVLKKFGIGLPVSVVELDLELFVAEPKFPGLFLEQNE